MHSCIAPLLATAINWLPVSWLPRFLVSPMSRVYILTPELQLLAASTDTPEVHLAWIKTARKRGGLGFMQVRAN